MLKRLNTNKKQKLLRKETRELLTASQDGDLEKISKFIRNNFDINSKNENGLTALHLASKEGHTEVIRELLKHGADVNSTTKRGNGALHMACVGGQLDGVRVLLENDANINAQSENGFTPLYVAAQENHVDLVKFLLDNGANAALKTDDLFVPLDIALQQGNGRVVECLVENDRSNNKACLPALHVAAKHSDVRLANFLLDENGYDVNRPSTSGFTALHSAARYGNFDICQLLIEKGADVNFKAKNGITALHVCSKEGHGALVDLLLSHGADPNSQTKEGLTALHCAAVYGRDQALDSLVRKGALLTLKTKTGLTPLHMALQGNQISCTRQLLQYNAPIDDLSERRFDCSSPSKTFDRDPRTSLSLVLPGSPSASFWSSFLTDARGGEMVGCRHSGVRVILPPSQVPNPLGIRCKLIRKEKLPFAPLLRQGEGLACRALETAPAGSKFLGPVIFEVPHFASLRNEEREIVILRSDDGKSWTEHRAPSFDELEPVLKNSLLSDVMRPNSRSLMRIVTVDLPHFFVLVSRIRMKQGEFFADEGSLSATLTPKVKITFPPGSFRRKTKVGLQAQPVSQVAVSKVFGAESGVSPIVTIEPQRRKFRSPVSVTMPLSLSAENEISAQNTRLLCSLSDGKVKALWEDISDVTPLTLAGDIVSFTTSVSGKYWLLSSPKVDLSAAQKLYSLTIPVPYFSRFVIFAKRLSVSEGQLRIFCMTDDKVNKTLERQEHFIEVARSEDVEVLDGTAVYVHLEGNLLPSNTAPDDHLRLNFHAFRENRLPLAVTVVNSEAEPSAQVTFTRDPGPRVPPPPPPPEISALRVTLPAFDDGKGSEKIRSTPVFQADKANVEDDGPELLKAELRLADVAELIGDNWKQVAERLGIPRPDVLCIQSDYDDPIDQAFAVLRRWMADNGSRANGNSLEKALRGLGMDDVIASCMINVADVTDAEEKAAAKSYLDAGVDPLSAEPGSDRHRKSPDDNTYEEIQARKVGLLLSNEGGKDSDEGNKCTEEMAFRERFPFMDRSVSTDTLTTRPSSAGDAETLNQQSTDSVSSSSIVMRAEVHEEETKQEDGSCVTRRVATVRHFKRRRGSDNPLLTRVEMDEDITVLSPGVTLPLLGDDAVLETDVDNSEEMLDNGVLLVHKITRTRVTKAPPGEKDAHRQETVPLPSENFSVDDCSSASPPSSDGLLSTASGSSAPQKALGPRIPAAQGVLPVVEEELTEGENGQTFRSVPPTSPSKWNASDRLEADVISQRDNEVKVAIDLERDPNCKNTSRDILSTYPEDEKRLERARLQEHLSPSNKRLSAADLLSAKEEGQTESVYASLESGSAREFLLEDSVTDERQTDTELFQSLPQHESPLEKAALVLGGRGVATEFPCKDSDSLAVLQDMESGPRGDGKTWPSIKLESEHLRELFLPNSAPEFINKECHNVTEFNREYGGQREDLSEEKTAENSEEGRPPVNEEAKRLKSPHQPQPNALSLESQPKERQSTVCKYLDSGPEHDLQVTKATSTTDGGSGLVRGSEGHGRRPDRGPTDADPLSPDYPKQAATGLEYVCLEPETPLEILPEELASGHHLESTEAFVERSLSGKTKAAGAYESKQQRVFPPEIVGEEIDSKTLQTQENLPLSAFEEDDEIIGETKPVEGTLTPFYDLSPAQLGLLPDGTLFGRRTLEDEEKSEGDVFKQSSVILRRRVHKKTLLTAGLQEQTIITEDTQVEQDNEAPKELSAAIQQIIEQFVHGKNSFVTCYNAC